MKALIVAGGQLGDIDFIKGNLPTSALIICADGGARHLKSLGLKPRYLVGDFDSIPRDILAEYREFGVIIKKYPKEKDWTDTQIAIDLAIEKGAEEVYFIGALGDRWDHSYANLMLLYRLEKRGIKGIILHSQSTILMSNDTLKIKGESGQILSLLPFSGDVHIESTEGLAYPLHDAILTMDYPLGISNVMVSDKAIIRIGNGWLIGILARD